jgi:hypothetical protein
VDELWSKNIFFTWHIVNRLGSTDRSRKTNGQSIEEPSVKAIADSYSAAN